MRHSGMGRLQLLFQKYLDNHLSPDEFAEFWQLLDAEEQLGNLSPELQQLWEKKPAYNLPDNHWNSRFKALKTAQEPVKKWPDQVWRYAAAAVLLLILGGSYQFFNKRQESSQKKITAADTLPNDVKAGTNGAILTFANGKTIVLDTARNGHLTKDITKTDASIAIEGKIVEYATLTTPRGKQQQLVLSDGTKVWLNAASSIRFPTVFTGNDRVVETTGEVSIKVVHNDKMPFKVKVRGQLYEDLGTEFNINAYESEPVVRTTVSEGLVRINDVFIKAGQQTEINTNGQIRLIEDADIELATAWKNGQQVFKKADIATIMRQVERWYNVDVEYKTALPSNMTFTGELPREVNLSALLRVFENRNVHFEIDGNTRKVTVTP